MTKEEKKLLREEKRVLREKKELEALKLARSKPDFKG